MNSGDTSDPVASSDFTVQFVSLVPSLTGALYNLDLWKCPLNRGLIPQNDRQHSWLVVVRTAETFQIQLLQRWRDY